MNKERFINMMRKVLIALGIILASLFIVLANKTETKAAQGFVIVYTAESADVKAEPDDSSKTIATVGKDTSFFVTANMGDGWYKTTYGGYACYIKASKLKILKASINVNPATILGASYKDEIYSEVTETPEGATEATEVAEEDDDDIFIGAEDGVLSFEDLGIDEEAQERIKGELDTAAEEVEKIEEDQNRLTSIKRKSLIWKIIIGIIIAAMFAVGIVSVIIKKKSENDDAAADKNSGADKDAEKSADADSATDKKDAADAENKNETADAENNAADSKEATEAASAAENDTKAAETENSEIIDLDSDESLNVKK